MVNATFLPSFSVKIFFQPIYIDYSYFENKKSHEILLLRNFSWNDV